MTNPLRDFSHKHEDELMDSLKCNKYQYGVGLMIFVSLVSERFRAVKVRDMLVQGGTDLFFKEKLARDIVDDRRRRSWTQCVADFGEPGTEYALRPI